MNLNRRVVRFEATANQQRSARCRWHGPLVIYQTTVQRDGSGQPMLPPCENPVTCPGSGKAQIFLLERRP